MSKDLNLLFSATLSLNNEYDLSSDSGTFFSVKDNKTILFRYKNFNYSIRVFGLNEINDLIYFLKQKAMNIMLKNVNTLTLSQYNSYLKKYGFDLSKYRIESYEDFSYYLHSETDGELWAYDSSEMDVPLFRGNCCFIILKNCPLFVAEMF